MKNLFIEYPKCSTCQKAKKWLQENNIEFEDRHIVEQTPTVASRLGHAQITTTLNFYVHPVEAHNKEAGNVLEKMLV